MIKVKNFAFLTFIFSFLILSGCLKDTPESAANGSNGIQGCVSATAMSPTSIQVEFEFPSSASKVAIYRNSALAATFFTSGTTSFLYTGLQEGTAYTYECVLTKNNKDILGSEKPTATTSSVTPPTFTGITSATLVGSNIVLTWNIATGVPTTAYKIFANPGAASGDISFVLSPLMNVTNSSEFTGHTSSGLSSGATDLSIANMRTEANFTSAGWNFTTVWKMPTSNTVNNGFPILRNVTPEWE